MKGVFEDKIAIVTGGASGIGEALGRELAARKAKVVLADRQIERARAVAEDIESKGGEAHATFLDVRDRVAFEDVARDAVKRFGRIDYLFNNAGIGVGGEMSDYAPADFDDVFDVNLRGVAHGIHAVYPRMVQQGFGHVVNTASVAGLVPMPGNGSYTAAKHGVVGLSKALRIEARRHGVKVSVLCPGPIATPILTGGEFGRTGLPPEVSRAALAERWERARPMSPEVFTIKALDRVAKGDAVIVVPSWYKALWYVDRLSPTLSLELAFWVHRKIRADLDALTSAVTKRDRSANED